MVIKTRPGGGSSKRLLTEAMEAQRRVEALAAQSARMPALRVTTKPKQTSPLTSNVLLVTVAVMVVVILGLMVAVALKLK